MSFAAGLALPRSAPPARLRYVLAAAPAPLWRRAPAGATGDRWDLLPVPLSAAAHPLACAGLTVPSSTSRRCTHGQRQGHPGGARRNRRLQCRPCRPLCKPRIYCRRHRGSPYPIARMFAGERPVGSCAIEAPCGLYRSPCITYSPSILEKVSRCNDSRTTTCRVCWCRGEHYPASRRIVHSSKLTTSWFFDSSKYSTKTHRQTRRAFSVLAGSPVRQTVLCRHRCIAGTCSR